MQQNNKKSDSYSRFMIPVKKFKQGYLELPQEYVHIVGSKLEKEPLIFRDQEGRKYVFDLYPKRLLLGGLGEWYRNHNPNVQDTIIIEPLNLDERSFIILIDQKKEGGSMEGLYIGKEYSMVGGRKYELSTDFLLPITDLLTHVFICGVTGSGKTVLGKAIIEEAALKGIPAIIVDLKGDLTSLILTFESFDPGHFETWVEGKDKNEKRKNAKIETTKHQERLLSFGINEDYLKRFNDKIHIKIFTPRSRKGISLAFASPLSPPEDAIKLYEDQREEFNNLVASLTNAFIDRLYPGVKRSRIENERNYLYELVHYAWLHEVNLDGKNGMLQLLRLAEEPPFTEIGGLPVDEYISAENRKRRLLNKINTLISGPEEMWFEGEPLDIKLFNLEGSGGKTQLNIINVTELDHFEDRSFVVAQIAYKIYEWMRKLGGISTPRVIFYIDEIGSGGGKQAFYPSYPYESASKWGINYLIRQGRSQGVCCLLATQNPGDIDYKGLSNCGTWIVGKLGTDRDRKKVMEGMAIWGSDAEKVRSNLTNANTGDFVIKDIHGNVRYIKERWLLGYHRVLTLNELAAFTKEKGGRVAEVEAEDSKEGPPLEDALQLYDPKLYALYKEACSFCESKPEACLNTVRKILEGLCERIAVAVLSEKDLRVFRKSLFSDQLDYLKNKGVFKTRKLTASIDFLKKWGDIASHYQEGEGFTAEESRVALKNLENVLGWYVREFKK